MRVVFKGVKERLDKAIKDYGAENISHFEMHSLEYYEVIRDLDNNYRSSSLIAKAELQDYQGIPVKVNDELPYPTLGSLDLGS